VWKSVDFVYMDFGGLLGAQDLRSLSFSSSLQRVRKGGRRRKNSRVSLCGHREESRRLSGGSDPLLVVGVGQMGRVLANRSVRSAANFGRA
jgi:hypothetical protein